MGPSFLHTITAFLLDFQGPGLPGESKKREQTASGNLHFFELKKMASKTVFSDFRLLIEVKNHTKKSTKKSTLATYFWEGVRNRSGTLFSSILD